MTRNSRSRSTAHREFVVHTPTDRVGSVVRDRPVEARGFTTVRLAGGELESAPADEFRPATDPEIERHHRVAALVRPVALPTLPEIQFSSWRNQHGHRLEL